MDTQYVVPGTGLCAVLASVFQLDFPGPDIRITALIYLSYFPTLLGEVQSHLAAPCSSVAS